MMKLYPTTLNSLCLNFHSLCFYFLGGGWAFGSIDSHDLVTARLAEQTGIAILSVDYRLAPEHRFPVPLRDCWDALFWLQRERGSLFQGVQRIGVAGDSAGAALAAGLTLMARKERGPSFHHQALIYPGLRASRPAGSAVRSPGLDQSSMDFYLQLYLADKAQAKDPYAMPLEAEDLSNLPQALIMVASEDVLRADGETYAERLTGAGVKSELLLAEGMPHTFLRIIHLEQRARSAFAEFCRCMALAYGEEYRAEALQ